MAIEIRELVIKAFVEEEGTANRKPVASSDDERRRLIEDCVEQVMRLLKQEKEP